MPWFAACFADAIGRFSLRTQLGVCTLGPRGRDGGGGQLGPGESGVEGGGGQAPPVAAGGAGFCRALLPGKLSPGRIQPRPGMA